MVAGASKGRTTVTAKILIITALAGALAAVGLSRSEEQQASQPSEQNAQSIPAEATEQPSSRAAE